MQRRKIRVARLKQEDFVLSALASSVISQRSRPRELRSRPLMLEYA